MCAYNVRINKRVDHDPPSAQERHRNQRRELGILLVVLVVMATVAWLVGHFLF